MRTAEDLELLKQRYQRQLEQGAPGNEDWLKGQIAHLEIEIARERDRGIRAL